MHAADSHDLIRVHGARENNLRDISVELPKRRLTVFTGVSGSGKSSLVFSTIAAESQRMINETYSAFVQGFMPNLGRPDVDVLDGLTTAIIVDQERMGGDVRSTVGTATDVGALLRILFSRLGTPYAGPAKAFSFNVATISGSGAVTVSKNGRQVKERREFEIVGGACPRCEGRGSVSDVDLTALYDESKSIVEGALTIPNYSVDGWYGRIFANSGFFPGDKPISSFTKPQLNALLYKEPTRIKVDGINVTFEGLIPRIQKSFLAKEREAMQPHIRAFVDRAIVFQRCPDCDGTRLSELARSSTIRGISIADACAMQISDLADWVRQLDEPSVAPLLGSLRHTLDSFVEIGLGYLSLDRPSGSLSGGEAQRTKMIKHLGSSLTDVTYVFDEPTIGLHPHDIARMNDLLLRLRDKGNTVLVVEHKPEDDRDRRPRRRPGAAGRRRRRARRLHRRPRRAAGVGHADRPAPGVPGVAQAVGADPERVSGDPRGGPAQPARSRRRRPARGAHRRHRGGRVGQELADPRLDRRARRRGRRRPGGDQGVAAQQPRHLHRAARTDPQGLRQGQRCQAGPVQRQQRGRLPELQRRRRRLHRSGDDGRRRHHLRRLRRPPLRRLGARLHLRRARHQRGPRHAGGRGGEVPRGGRGPHPGRAQDPGAPRRRRARLPHPGPAADHAVRRRAPAAQAGGAPGGVRRDVRARRADDRAATWPTSSSSSRCSTGSSTAAAR
jgi:energy-coupling factor transporter ATP-binding protein EcfA2